MEQQPQNQFQPRRTEFRDALGRLATYRDSLPDDATINMASGLTASDLDVLLDHLVTTQGVRIIRTVEMSQLALALPR